MSEPEDEKRPSTREIENYYSVRQLEKSKIAPRNDNTYNSMFRPNPGIIFLKGNTLEANKADPISKVLYQNAESSEFVQDLVELSGKPVSNNSRIEDISKTYGSFQNDSKPYEQNQYEIESLDGPSISISRKARLANKLPAHRELTKVSVSSSIYRKSRIDDAAALRNSELDFVLESTQLNRSQNETSLSKSLINTNPNETYNVDKQTKLLEELDSVIEMPNEEKGSPKKIEQTKSKGILRELDEPNFVVPPEGNSFTLAHQIIDKKQHEPHNESVEEKLSRAVNDVDVEGENKFEEEKVKKEEEDEEEVENASVNQDKNEVSKQNEEKKEDNPGEKCCRICLEEEQTSSTGILLRPCQCQGTMELIHEECLKTWLVSKGLEADEAACELCKTKFRMVWKEKLKFYPRLACEDGVGSFLTCGCLSLIIFGLVIVVILIAINWGNTDDSPSNPVKQNSSSFKVAVVVACLFIGAILSVLAIVSCKEAFFIPQIADWKILPWTQEWQREQDELVANQRNEEDLENRPRSPNARRSRRRILPANQSSAVIPRRQNDQAQDENDQSDLSDVSSQQQPVRDRSGLSLGMREQVSQDGDSRSVSPELDRSVSPTQHNNNMSLNDSRLDRTHDELLVLDRKHQSGLEESKSQSIPPRNLQEDQKYDNENHITENMNQQRLINLSSQSYGTGNRKFSPQEEEKMAETNDDASHNLGSLKASKASIEKNPSQQSLGDRTLQRMNSSKSGTMQYYQEISPRFVQNNSRSGDQHLTLEVRVDPRKRDVVIENITGNAVS